MTVFQRFQCWNEHSADNEPDSCGPGRRSCAARTVKQLFFGAAVAATLTSPEVAAADPGTREDRAALFEYIVDATMKRTAFSPFKPIDIGAGPEATEAQVIRNSMLALRQEFLAANTDEKLYFALVKMNAARWDSHLKLQLTAGGINPFEREAPAERHAPIKFKPDYSDKQRMFLFVSDFSRHARSFNGTAPAVGDKLLSVNGVPADIYLERLGKFLGRSSHRALWWALAENVAKYAPAQFAPEMYAGGTITYELQSRSGATYRVVLPYQEYETIEWAGHDDHYAGVQLARLIAADPKFVDKTHQVEISQARYRGFEHIFSRPSFDLYASPKHKILLLQGHRFGPTIKSDLAAVLEHARTFRRFDYAVIYDLTRSSGGDFEEGTLQRLQSRPFKIMFGNLRISDITRDLAKQIRGQVVAKMKPATRSRARPRARDIAEANDGSFLLEWLDRDLAAAIASGQAYTSDVQFENQFLPVGSDGFLYPTKEHFTGPMVLFTAPYSCSGADQFASMFIDNNLGLSVGMPQGGCSNTWEWKEVLKFPRSGKPVAQFAWTAGHSIRANGEVLEGNSALPRIHVPLTRDNYLNYYDILMGHALQYIYAQRTAGNGEPSKLDRITDNAKMKRLAQP